MHIAVRVLLLALSLALAGCTTHVHPRYPTWQTYHQAHPQARFVVVHQAPARHRTCWNVRPDTWRCVR